MSNTKILLETIEAGLAADAGELARQIAANACRQLLVVLEAKPGEQLAQVVPLPTALPTPLPGSVPPGVPQPAAMNPTLLLDALIARLRSSLPQDEQAEPVERGLSIPFVPIPPGRGS